MIISLYDRVENIVGTGEIVCTSNFSFFHNVFKRLLFLNVSKGVTVWEWVKPFTSEASCTPGQIERRKVQCYSTGAEPNDSVGSTEDLRTGGRRCNLELGKYSFQ